MSATENAIDWIRNESPALKWAFVIVFGMFGLARLVEKLTAAMKALATTATDMASSASAVINLGSAWHRVLVVFSLAALSAIVWIFATSDDPLTRHDVVVLSACSSASVLVFAYLAVDIGVFFLFRNLLKVEQDAPKK